MNIPQQVAQKLLGNPKYHIILARDGIWMITDQTPAQGDEVLFSTDDHFEAERALCRHLALCD
jgi:hypothetical protein